MGFIGYGFLSVIIARVFCIFFTSGVAYLFMRKSWKLNILEMSIVWFAGNKYFLFFSIISYNKF